jgi:hypothetical protein
MTQTTSDRTRFSHLSLIKTAINLDYQIDHGAGAVDEVLSGP